jgi:molybdopterin-synthase adenylyltransferase
MLSDAEKKRYSRQIRLFGEDGQEKLKRTSVFIAGAGGLSGYQGQATTIIPGKTACLSCIFPRAPPATIFPALGCTCGVIGSIQVSEAVKYVTGAGQLLENRLLLWDGLSGCLDEMAYERNPACQECSNSGN